MRTPIKAKRELLITVFGVGYYMPVNLYERIYAKWDFFISRVKFRMFIVKDKIRYARKRRSKRTLDNLTVSLPQGNWPDVW